MNLRNIAFLLLVFLLTACRTTDTVGYFQDIETLETGAIENSNVNYETKIMPDDQLSIFVSSIDPAAVAMFNLPLTSYQSVGDGSGISPTSTTISSAPSYQTYLVDNKGYIDFPVLGQIKVEGMTRSQLSEYLKDKISAYAKSPLVTVRILNFKVSVLGEVNIPGTKNVQNERVTILDAIGMAGDLTINGTRNNVLIIRDTNGKKEFQRVDLTSSELLNSPYYYLQQNDIVYIEPNQARKSNARYSQSKQFNISVASTVVSAISVIASLAIALLVK